MKYLAAVLLFLSASYARAATYWVSPTGAATWSDCSNSTPLNGTSACSIPTAMANAMAGDIVNFRGGTYSVTDTQVNDHGTYEPAHSGTNGNSITFQAYTSETPIINMNNTWTGDKSLSPPAVCYVNHALGAYGQSYIIWDGFTLQTSNNTSTGVSMNGLPPTFGVGNIVRNITEISGNQSSNDRNNCDLNSLTYQDGLQFYNNTIQGFDSIHATNGGQGNPAAIKIYIMQNSSIHNNEIYGMSGVGDAIKAKQQLNTTTISYNYLHNNSNGIVALGYNTCGGSPPTGSCNSQDIIHDNVLVYTTPTDAYACISNHGQDSSNSDGWQVYNNTCYTPNALIDPGHGHSEGFSMNHVTANRIYNNIQWMPQDGNSGHLGQLAYDAGSTIKEEDYNLFWPSPVGINNQFYGGTFYNTLAFWQASPTLIGGGHPGTSDLASDPLFVNGSGNFSKLSDFNLCVAGQSGCSATSPSKGTGRGGIDMGAQIRAVGVNASCSGGGVTFAPPSAPRGFTLQ